jgi:hypothetical protein
MFAGLLSSRFVSRCRNDDTMFVPSNRLGHLGARTIGAGSNMRESLRDGTNVVGGTAASRYLLALSV